MPTTTLGTAPGGDEGNHRGDLPLLTAEEVADRIDCHRSTVYGLPLPRVRIGRGTVRFRSSDLPHEETPESELGGKASDEAIRLLDADEVADRLSIPRRRVYQLPIPRVEIGDNTLRWRPEDVEAFVEERLVRA